MSAISSLSNQKIWSLLHGENEFSLLSSPHKVLKIYSDKILNLLTNIETSDDGLSYLENYLAKKKCDSFGDNLWVVHTFYELGYAWNKLKNPYPDQPIAIILEFDKKESINPQDLHSSAFTIDWSLPEREEYFKAFSIGLDHLKRGDCYQYNLTFPFFGKMKNASAINLISSLWSLPERCGEFASFSLIEDDFYFSNSPECLFEWDSSGTLESRPIKGTIYSKEGDDEKAWDLLRNCKKNESELFMITDLLRNDMNRIDKAVVEVVEKKAPLKVPGLIHSYSHLRVNLSHEISLLDIMKSLFPGGSITGAPKIRVMEIIHDLEKSPRGFYCGSTLSRKGDKIVGSINIRSGVGNISEGQITYQAGGGITFESEVDAEYQEMLDKFSSVSNLLTSNKKLTYQ